MSKRQGLKELHEQLKLVAHTLMDAMDMARAEIERQQELEKAADVIAEDIVAKMGSVRTLTPDELRTKIANGLKLTFAKGGKY